MKKKKIVPFKYVGNFSTNSSNGFVGGLRSNNYLKLKRDLIDFVKNYGGQGGWFIEVFDEETMQYIPLTSGRVK